MWFDGGSGPDASAIRPLLREIAPRALVHNDVSFTDAGSIRWMGNERGMVRNRQSVTAWVERCAIGGACSFLD